MAEVVIAKTTGDPEGTKGSRQWALLGITASVMSGALQAKPGILENIKVAVQSIARLANL